MEGMGYTWTTRSLMVPPLGARLSRMSRYARIQATNKAMPLRSSALGSRYGELEDDGVFYRFHAVR